MNIFGQEYEFLLTIGASEKIAGLCPDGDMTRIGEMLDAKTADLFDFFVQFILSMSEGSDENRRFWGKELNHDPLTAEKLRALSFKELKNIQAEAMKKFKEDMATTVEVAPPKKEENPPEEGTQKT